MDDNRPLSIFELGYFNDPEQAQNALDEFPTGDEKVLHLPSHEDIFRIRDGLRNIAKENPEGITSFVILMAYQDLSRSASSSDIICCEVVNNHKCGGIIDLEISPFGRYYQCRKNSNHRFPA
jgi:hypothetical protein